MAGNVEYMTGAQMISALGAANQAVSGMTYAEAAAAIGGAAQTAEGGASILTFPIKYQEYGQTTIEAQYAAQLWEYWKTVAGAEGTTVLGAAAGAAISYGKAALIGTGQGLAATAGILTMSVPTAVAMAAPLLGFGLGYTLYESNPEFWDKIGYAVAESCVKGSEVIEALITEAGQILLPKSLVDSLDNLFREEGLYDVTKKSTYFPNGLPVGGSPCDITRNGSYYDHWETIATGVVFKKTTSERQYGVVAVAASPNNGAAVLVHGNNTYVTNDTWLNAGQRAYFRWEQSGATGGPGTVFQISGGIENSTYGGGISKNLAGQIAWTLLYGTASQVLPEGVSNWNGVTPDLANTPTTPVYDPQTQTTRPYYPVHLPSGDTPGTTETDPSPTTDPTRVTPPVEYPDLNPYIPPVVNPEIQWPEELPMPDQGELTNPDAENDPIYVPEPVLDPATDPAAQPEPVPNPETAYPGNDGLPPQSTGTSPPIAFPPPLIPFPTISPNASETPVVSGEPGFVQVYHPSPSELLQFGRWLWVTYADATIDKIWNNPFDGVIGCHELYATPTDGGYTTIRCGFLDSGVSAQLVRLRYSTINCGSMIIPEYWGNYLDYSPYAKAYIYLPFIGIQEIDVDDVVGHAVNVCYHIDAYNGSCIAQITCAKDGYTNTLYQFSGNCAVEYPLSGGSQAAIKAAMMTGDAYQSAANTAANASLIGGIGSGLASAIGGMAGGVAQGIGGNLPGGVATGISGAAHGVASVISGYASSVAQRAYGEAQHTANMLSGKSIVQHSGTFGASYGAMGIKKPYIFIRRPIQKVVNNYNILYGYPAHKQVIIGNCTGFLRCREVSVVSPLATESEKILIEQLLTSGVYVTDEFSQLNS